MDSINGEEIDSRVRDAFGDELPDASAVERTVNSRIRAERSIGWLSLAAAAVILVALSGYLLIGRAHRIRVYGDLAHDHQREVVQKQARRWRSDAGEVEKLAARYGLTQSMTLAMAPTGYRLEHAKTCGMDGRPVLHLVYTNGSKEFSVYVRPRGSANYAGTADIDSEQISAVRTAHFEAAVVRTGRGEECLELARRVASVL